MPLLLPHLLPHQRRLSLRLGSRLLPLHLKLCVQPVRHFQLLRLRGLHCQLPELLRGGQHRHRWV